MVGGRELRLARPADADALATQEAYEAEEFLPHWAELWPSAHGLAQALVAADLRGKRVVDLGCGLGLTSLAAALAGADVLATDWSPDATAATAHNAQRNGLAVGTLTAAWQRPAELLALAPFDLAVASDVVYEPRNIDMLVDLLPRLGETFWIGDPGRAVGEPFFARMKPFYADDPLRVGKVTVHRLTRRR